MISNNTPLIIFEKPVFAITSKILRISTEHTEPIDRQDFKLQIQYTSFIEIIIILEVITILHTLE